ncbi:uncharacterized protein FYW49_008042 [Xenentodon cancila]
MSICEPSDKFPVRGGSGSSMKLPLHSAGDHNGNAFPISSSSSSSSSSSCLGESSPESLRSLSSLSGGRTDSPLDYDVLEVTLTTTVMTKEDAATDVVLSKWSPEEGGQQQGDDEEEEVSAGRDFSKSNETSLSVYLDADGSGDNQESWNDNRTLALSLQNNDGSHSNNGDLSSGSSAGRRRGSFTPDSDTTEIPADDDDEEEEALFVSVSSDFCVRRSSVTLTQENLAGLTDCRSERVLGGDQNSMQASNGPGDLSKSSQTLVTPASVNNPAEDAPTVVPPPPEEPESCPKAPQSNLTSKSKQSNTSSSTSTAVKAFRVEAKRVSKPAIKSVKAKDESRCNTFPPKTTYQGKQAPADGKKPIISKDQGDGSKGLSPGPIKVAVILRPIRGRSSNLKNNHKVAVTTSPAQLKKVVVLSRALSDSTSSVGSEGGGGSTDAPRKAVQDHGMEMKRPAFVEGAGEANPEKPRSPGRRGMADTMVSVRSSELRPLSWDAVTKHQLFLQKVSSRLGPGASRQLARGTVAPPPPPPLGLGTGPPGLQQAQTDGGQSPSKGRLSLNHGIPKPRTTAERASALQSPAASVSKAGSNQQPAVGSAGRPAAPAASKLPVKGSTLSSSQPGNGENDAAASKGPSAPPGSQTDERSSRTTLPAGGQSPTKLPACSYTALTDAVSSAAVKPPPVRSRAPSLQARTSATGLKAPTNHSAAKAAAASQTAAKASPSGSQGPTRQATALQRSGSARLGRLSGSGLDLLIQDLWLRETEPFPQLLPDFGPSPSSCEVCQDSFVTLVFNSSERQHLRDCCSSRFWRTETMLWSPRLSLSNFHVKLTAKGLFRNLQLLSGCRKNTVVFHAVWAQQLCMSAWETPVDKNKPREAPTRAANPCSQPGSQVTAAGNLQLPPPEQSASRTGGGGAAVPTVVEGTIAAKRNQNKEQAERRNQAISQLRRLLVQGNRRVEALATVIQHLFTAREDALRQKKELSLQLEKLRSELVTSSQCCERLQKEKEEARVSSEEALRRLEEQHREDLVQLEDRLRSFYQTEWDKVHQVYQEEADKCRLLMEQQVEELRSRQEAERKNQEVSHSQKVESLRQQYEASIEELKKVQKTELEDLQKTLKDTETSLSEQISELSAEKEDLSEKLRAEEERRQQILGDKTLKDSHTVYLERELESLKVVLEIKNNQLHQKEKKLMEMDKLVETNVKLEECLKKVQQENEDYKARMDKHAALSKQLSTEQAILQQTLQKESKVNKRLSMENEELLWKLHNGDLLASPRRLSPTSPFGSPRNSASFPTAAPLSPR